MKTALEQVQDYLQKDVDLKFLKQKDVDRVNYYIDTFFKQTEREQLINFHIETMKLGLIKEGDDKWSEFYEPRIRECAEQYFNQTFNK